jgi:hypothetical protein
MGSGDKQVVINAMERAVSTDIMRGQNFEGAMLSELFRALVNTGQGGGSPERSVRSRRAGSRPTRRWSRSRRANANTRGG